jgi:F-type H+-transporting ATPase subunit alpha
VAPAPINGASKQVRTYAADAKASPTEVSSILEQRIRGVQEEAGLAETGRVLSVGCVNNLGYCAVVARFERIHLGDF